jgi:hypothetical protein
MCKTNAFWSFHKQLLPQVTTYPTDVFLRSEATKNLSAKRRRISVLGEESAELWRDSSLVPRSE